VKSIGILTLFLQTVLISLFDCGLIDKHHRYVIADRIYERAFSVDAFKSAAIGLQFNR
jgi:hypothetical protein